MAAVQGFEVVIIPNKDECFQPLERHCIPSSFEYKENRQGLSYTFEFFKQYGFDHVYVVCDNDMVSEQVSICAKGFKSFVKTIQVYGSKGTGDELQKISSQFHSDLIVVTGIPNLKMNLLNALDDYRIRSCTLLIVLEKLQNHKEDKNKVNSIYGITNDCRIISYADVSSRFKEFNIPKALLQDFPSFNLYTNLTDRNMYFCNTTFLNLLSVVKPADDLETEFIPALIRRQHYYRDFEEYRPMEEVMNAAKKDSGFVNLLVAYYL
ncbi:hypothetical protein WA588_005141 [Blastocystis sp. NMH]